MSASNRSNTAHKEQRRYRRSAVSLPATLIAGDLQFDCLVTDLSQLGARIELAQSFPVEGEVILHIGGLARYHARAIWQQGRLLGLGFSDPDTLSALF